MVTKKNNKSKAAKKKKTIDEVEDKNIPKLKSEYVNQVVPEILLSGNQAKIDAWRIEQSTKKTKQKRPDLLLK